MKALNIFLSLMFVLFAGLQYNDPDPYVWMPIYLYSAVFCWLAARQRFYPKWYIAGILVYLLYATYKFFDQNGVEDWFTKHNAENLAETMKATKPWIEETREFFGLFICIGALLMNYFYGKRKMKTGRA
ncbi:transmembrane family 220 protein [Chitinophaga polysaccharea]|uniref:Transmembrane family 220 protein n=1 Tax=Chitinophaga polysaccharea TaxID=1293035 RepID=A0A561Q4N8_9BACT|nr:transmembrane 220 family protein [Chitinophaga polysaccharea]TWF45330.1 transmembrane family 220 protein [Chitinophaga polysaccharea]